ncbi:MAG: hypothetical protein V1773_15425 [bacterium]
MEQTNEVTKSDAEQNMVILGYCDDHKKSDELTYALIENCIIDLQKSRELDCIFVAKSRRTATEFCTILINDLSYKADSPYLVGDSWVINATKMIVVAELRDTVKMAPKESTKYGCHLSDFNVEVDIAPKN